MGRGDKRSRRGKIFKSSYGNTRPHKTESAPAAKRSTRSAESTPAKKAPVTKKAK